MTAEECYSHPIAWETAINVCKQESNTSFVYCSLDGFKLFLDFDMFEKDYMNDQTQI